MALSVRAIQRDVKERLIVSQLIEIGKALASGDKEHGRTFAGGSTRLQTTIPSTAENFHRALDELEIDIVCFWRTFRTAMGAD